MMYVEEQKTSPVVIKVVGVGGGGMNALDRMMSSNLGGVEFIAVNTDEQVLKVSQVPTKVVIGHKVTRGMGAGGDPDMGSKSAVEDKDKIANVLKGADLVFVTAGMGGGTGTGAAPVIAEIAKELKCLVVGVVTVPFGIEGKKRATFAKDGLNNLRQHVDTLITIKNDSIFKVIDKKTSVNNAFKVIDDILLNAVKGISDIINKAGIINVDFADVRTIMKDTGDAIMGVGEGVGDNKVQEAVERAINNVLLEETSIAGANSLLINVTGGSELSLHDWNEVSNIITTQVDPNANIIIGLNSENELGDKIRVTVIATGFKKIASNNSKVSPFIKREISIDKELERQSRPVSVPETDIAEVTRSIKSQKIGNGGVAYNLSEDYDIPAYLRKGMNGNAN